MFSCRKMYRSLEMDELSTGQVLAFLVANDMNLLPFTKYISQFLWVAHRQNVPSSRLKLLKNILHATMGQERLATCATFYWKSVSFKHRSGSCDQHLSEIEMTQGEFVG